MIYLYSAMTLVVVSKMQSILYYVSFFRRVVRTHSNKKEGDSSPMIYNTALACHLITNCMYFSVLEVDGV